MNKYTSGPWRLKITKRAENGSPTRTDVNARNWEGLAVVYGTSDGTPEQLEEAEANARLIAAAPDLLEACQHILMGWVANSNCTFDIKPVVAAISRAVHGDSKEASESFAERVEQIGKIRCMFVSDIDG